MYSYVTEELPELLKQIDGLDLSNCSIMGHSMGGHGALIVALKNRGTFKVGASWNEPSERVVLTYIIFLIVELLRLCSHFQSLQLPMG